MVEKSRFITFNRPPRIIPEIQVQEIKIPPPPDQEDLDEKSSFVGMIFPILLAMIPMMLFAVVLFISSPTSGVGTIRLILAPIMMIMTFGIGRLIFSRGDRGRTKQNREKYQKKLKNYKTNLNDLREQIEYLYKRESSILHRLHPAPDQLKQIIFGDITHPLDDDQWRLQLWQRKPNDNDFLLIRVGLARQRSHLEIDYPDPLQFVILDESPIDSKSQLNNRNKTKSRDVLQQPPSLQQLLKTAQGLGQDHLWIDDAPLCLDFKAKGIIGIVGDAETNEKTYTLLYAVVAQVFMHHAPNDVNIFILSPLDKESDSPRWDWTPSIPHCNADARGSFTQADFVARDEPSSNALLERLYKTLNRRREQIEEEGANLEGLAHIVLVVDDFFLHHTIREHPMFTLIFSEAENLKITTIFNSRKLTELPDACRAILRLDLNDLVSLWYGETGNAGTRVPNAGWDIKDTTKPPNRITGQNSIWENDPQWRKVERKQAKPDVLEEPSEIAELVSNIILTSLGENSQMPNYVGFLDMFFVQTPDHLDVLRKWSEIPEDGRFPKPARIGMKNIQATANQQDSVVMLDLSQFGDGPHGLIAGTTGSGKSELLQSVVASLAIEHDPRFLAFFFIDYKGGSALSVFKDMPHEVGFVSDLDPALALRSLDALDNEVDYRKRVFAQYAVKDIYDYHKQYGAYLLDKDKNNKNKMPAVPHLVIIVDEFAELKSQLPDFLDQINSIARVGRSLGIHLILATQRPEGSISADVRANANFSICLRVKSAADSRDMIGKPDAAFLPSTPGRAYFQSTNTEQPVLFQTAYAGDVYNPRRAERIVTIYRIWWRKENEDEYGSFEYNSLASDAQTQSTSAGETSAEESSNTKSNQQQTETQTQSLSVGETSAEESSNTKSNQQQTENTVIEKVNATILLTWREIESLDESIKLRKLWQKPLPDTIRLNTLLSNFTVENADGIDEELEWSWSSDYWMHPNYNNKICIGLLDDPANRKQNILAIDWSNPNETPHIAIFGSSGTGKTNALVSWMLSAAQFSSPRQLHLYVLDFGIGNSLRVVQTLPHVGAYLDYQAEDRVRRFFVWIEKEMQSRREQKRNTDTSEDIIATLPQIVLVIDNFRELWDLLNSGADGSVNLESTEGDILEQIAQEGSKLGISLILSASERFNEIPSSVIRYIKHRIALQMNEADQMQLVLGTRTKFGDMRTGLGVWRDSPPLQLLIPLSYVDSGIKHLETQMRAIVSGKEALPHPIGTLGKTVSFDDMLDLNQQSHDIEFDVNTKVARAFVGIRHDNLDPWSIEFKRLSPHAFVVGGIGSGKTNLLQVVTRNLISRYSGSPDWLKLLIIAPNVDGSRQISQTDIGLLGDGLLLEPIVSDLSSINITIETLTNEVTSRRDRSDISPLIVIIDNLETFYPLSSGIAGKDSPAAKLDNLANLLAAGNFGVHFAVSLMYQNRQPLNVRMKPFLNFLRENSTLCLTSPRYGAEQGFLPVNLYRRLKRVDTLDTPGRIVFFEDDLPQIAQVAHIEENAQNSSKDITN